MEPEQTREEEEKEAYVTEEHHIETIGDLVAVATRENLENLLRDLGMHLAMTIDPDIAPLLRNPHVFSWVDDGRNDIYLRGKEEDEEDINEMEVEKQRAASIAV